MGRRAVWRSAAVVAAVATLAAPAATAAPGSPDPGFGNAGRLTRLFDGTSSIATSIALQPDGRPVVGGSATSPSGLPSFVVARFNADGTVDTRFGKGGSVVMANFDGPGGGARALVLQPDGELVAGGTQNSLFAIARYNPDGSLDQSFGSGGAVTTSFPDGPQSVVTVLTLSRNRLIAFGGRDPAAAGG